VKSGELPEGALLQRYRQSGAYTDCYFVDLDQKVSQADYIRAFYTTLAFKTERLILKWAISKPSTDEEANLLAEAKTDKFAAWYVEARRDEEILLSDFRDRTRSWLMTETSARSTRLYFGSAVVQIPNVEAHERRRGERFSLLLEFHKLYSRILLSSARRHLLR
jgi:hypothetical protein